MEFRILGPLEIFGDEGAREVRGLREQIVLAALLLAPNRVVPTDHLVDAIWGETAPATCRSQVQICVSSLRRQLAVNSAGELIVTRRPGYLIAIDDDLVDAHRFTTAVVAVREHLGAGRIQEAAALLRDSLALWRGNALEGISSKVVSAVATRMDEERLDLTEKWLELELEAGNLDVLPEVNQMVDRHPLRERFRAIQMLALYRSGRQVEALHAYRQTRELLVEELGIEPSAELQRLEHAILNGDVRQHPVSADDAAVTAAPIPRLLPHDIADFTGRAEDVAELSAPLMADDSGRPMRVAVVTGSGGVGKSALALHVAHRIGADHFPDGQLYAELGGTSRPTSSAHVLGGFLRALGVSGKSLPDGLDQRVDLFRATIADRRILIVLDDAVSESQIGPLLPGSGPSAVIVTSRRRLTGLAGATRVELRVLPEENAVELLGLGIGADRVEAAPVESVKLVEMCGHLPLAVRIVAARLAARPHWSVSKMLIRLTNETGRLDELCYEHMEVRASIAVSYQALDPQAQCMMRLLGLLRMPDFPAWIGGPLLDMDPEDAGDVIDDLVEARLLEASVYRCPGREDVVRYRFHDLVRAFAREQLVAEHPEEERNAVLRRVCSALLVLAEEAHRRAYGGDYLVIRSDAERYPVSAAACDDLLDDPLGWLELERNTLVAAIKQASAVDAVELCWDLALNAVTLFEARALYDMWRETHDIALAGALRAGDVRGQAATLYSTASLAMFRQEYAAATKQFSSALELFKQIDHKHGAALVMRNLTHVARVSGRLGEALDIGGAALEIFVQVGDAGGRAHLLRNLALAHCDAGEYAVALQLVQEALEVCDEAGLQRVRIQVQHALGEILLSVGRPGEALRTFRQVLSAVAVTGDDVGLCHTMLGLAEAERCCGNLRAAAPFLAEADGLSSKVKDKLLTARIQVASAELAIDTGDPEAARQLAGSAVAVLQQLGVPLRHAHGLVVIAEACQALGDVRSAHDQRVAATMVLACVTGPEGTPVRSVLHERIRASANATA